MIETSTYTQLINVGLDIGKKNIGLSGRNDNNEILSAKIELNSGKIKEALETRSMYRRARRAQLGYREERRDNRKASISQCKVCGGNSQTGKEFCRKCLKEVENNHHAYSGIQRTFAEKNYKPTPKHLVNSHLKVISIIQSILPVQKENIIFERAKFDIQKINNREISGVGYQQGEMFGVSSLRDFVIGRDDHCCQNPECKHKRRAGNDKNYYIKNNIVLVIHHIIHKGAGGTDKPSNLITLCVECHTPSNHQPGKFLHTWCVERKKVNKAFDAATLTNAISLNMVEFLPNFTWGSETKRKRQLMLLDKDHHNDAFAISLNPEEYFEFNSENKVVLKEGVIFNKIKTPDEIIQHGNRGEGRRALTNQFIDAKYIDSRDGSVKSGKDLSSSKKKGTEKLRKYRLSKVRKGKISLRKGKSSFENHSVISYIENGKKLITECYGMSLDRVKIKDNIGKPINKSVKKYNIIKICNRKGFIKR